MSQSWVESTLESIGSGQAIDQVNHQLKEVYKNIQDVNTDPQARRSITLKITFKPNHDRSEASVEFQTTAKLAPDAVGVDQVNFNPTGKAFVMKAEQLPLGVSEERFDPESGEVIREVGV